MVFDYADDYIDMLEQELGSFSFGFLLNIADRIMRRLMRDSSLVLSVSHELAKTGTGNVHVLANGVNSEYVLDPETSERKPMAERPVVGFIGSFEYFIDFDVILDCAAKRKDIDFLLVGRGRDYAAVADRVERDGLSNVTLTGGVPHTEIFDQIAKMDICLNIFKPIPVSHRACPIKLFEYMALNKPVISTRLHELKYIDEDFLYYADSAAELESAIDDIVSDQAKASANARSGLKLTHERYTWERLADQFVAMVNDA